MIHINNNITFPLALGRMLEKIIKNDLKWDISDVIRNDGGEIDMNIRISVINSIKEIS
jgi:hypothetical protein